jgi:hypothetical protein
MGEIVIPITALIPQPRQDEFRLFADDAYLSRATFTAVQEVPSVEQAHGS